MKPLTAAMIAVQQNAETLRGPAGVQGVAGIKGLDGINGQPGLVWRGPWTRSETYVRGDVVEYEGSAYVATGPSKGTPPLGSNWNLLAKKGADGVTRTEIVAHGMPGQGGGGTMTVSDEGVPIGPATGLDFAGPGVSAALVGGVAVVTVPGGVQTKEFLRGDAVLLPGDGNIHYLPWSTHVVGDVLLDRTDPLHPTIIEAGVYSISVNVAGPGPGAGIFDMTAEVGFGLDVADGDAYQDNQYPMINFISGSTPIYSQSITYYCPAGSEVQANFRHNYSIADVYFVIAQANVQRLS